MSGRTGKLTTEALEARGPRMVLTQANTGTEETGSMMVIYKEGFEPFVQFRTGSFMTRLANGLTVYFGILARSYTLSYLMRVARGNRNL
jgi:hypothetical protein